MVIHHVYMVNFHVVHNLLRLKMAVQFLVTGVVAFSLVTFAWVPSAQAHEQQESTRSTDYISFFVGKNDNLLNSGWSGCPTSITWSIDMGSLKPKMARVELTRLTAAFEQWSDASGLNFEFMGSHTMAYNPVTHHLSAPGMASSNHIAVAIIPSENSPLLKSNVFGFGMPSLVLDSANQIVGGVLVIKEEAVTANSKKDPRVLDNLYLHELGHVIGLGHVDDQSQVMYPTVYRKTTLGGGDIKGAFALTKPCR